MKLTVTKNKNFIEDCRRYEQVIKETKDTELDNLYRRFVSQARAMDASTDSIANLSNTSQERNKLKSLRIDIEKKIMSLREKI